MAKIKIGAIQRFTKLKQELKNKKYLDRLAIFARDLIYKRIKSGYGVTDDSSPNPDKQKLKRLSSSYIEYRKGKVQFYTDKQGRVRKFPTSNSFTFGPFGSSSKSNLTFSGQMLESIEYRINNNSITMRIPNSRRSDGKTNKEVAGYVRKERPFFAFTKSENRVILNEWKKIVQMVLNK